MVVDNCLVLVILHPFYHVCDYLCTPILMVQVIVQKGMFWNLTFWYMYVIWVKRQVEMKCWNEPSDVFGMDLVSRSLFVFWFVNMKC